MIVIAIMLLGFTSALLHAFVLSKMWAWFVTSTFTSMPRLGTLTIYGLLMVVDMIRFKPDGKPVDGDVNKRAGMVLFERAVYALIALGCGAIVHALNK